MRCPVEGSGPRAEAPVQCELTNGHDGAHRHTYGDDELGILIWPVPSNPKPAERLASAFATLFEAGSGAGVDGWGRQRMELTAEAFEQIGHPEAAANLRKHWVVRNPVTKG